MEPFLSVHGNDSSFEPVRSSVLPYGRQEINEDDIQAVIVALQSDWLTTGPRVQEFERAFAAWVGSSHAVALSNGTAALHACMAALRIGSGDEVIVPAMTFAASANCVVYCGGTPVFADVDKGTLLLDPESVADRITKRTRAVVAVDYGGQPCDYDAIREVAPGIPIVADACHAPGATYRGQSVGTLAELNCFSTHPVKHFTTGEGGLVTTEESGMAEWIRAFRNHGITTDHRQRAEAGSWYYEMVDLGYNYRLTDFQCALGISQLTRLRQWVDRRREIAALYDKGLSAINGIQALAVRPEVEHSYHLYVVRLFEELFGTDRQSAFASLRQEGIGVNVHYPPVHLHPYYTTHFGTGRGLCPVAEDAYEKILSLPMFPGMLDSDVEDVLEAMQRVRSRV